ncbi:MAG: iron complex outermembrane receptor protein [Arenicella sp.]|jgi:iron complex outermembrane receptor protein
MKFLLNAVAFATIASISATGQAQIENGDSEEGIEEIIVVGTDQSRYITTDKGALTGFQLGFLESPRVVNIIPEQLVLDQKITDLNEALRNTPGITQSDGFGGTNDDFFIRGFRRNVVYRDGFRRATNFKTNLSNVDYTQVVRGPASITYGQVEPGGLVDIVTKKPLEERRMAGEARVGSFDDRLLLLDFSEPLSDRAGLRVVASTQDAESFRDFTDISRDTISISAKYDFTDATRLDASYEYRDESRPLDRGTVTVNTPNGREIINDLIDIPIERRFGEEFEVFESEFNFFNASLTHQFDNGWALKLGAAKEDSTANDIQARPRAVVILNQDAPITSEGFFFAPVAPEALFDDPSDQVFLARRTDGSRDRQTDVTYYNALLSGEFQTGNINHRLAIGADYRSLDTSRFFVTTATTNGIPEVFGGRGALFDIRNPIYGNLSDTLSTEGRPLQELETTDFGFFINDYIELTDQLSLLIGGRYDDVEFGTPDASFKTDSFSPQVALNYQVAQSTSMFISYSEAFEPNTTVFAELGQTEAFEPEESDQIELGIKSEFFDGKLQTSAALYSIDKTNVLTAENGLPVLRDGQSSQGFEASISGQPISGMNIIAGYAYTDAEIAGKGVTGNRPRNVGDNTFNLWASYEFQTGAFEGVGVGGGAFYNGDRAGDDANSFTLDSYTLVDLSAWYTVQVPGGDGDRTVRFQLAAKNLFDEEYFPASGGNERINIGTPRTVFGSVSFDF